MVKGRVDEHGGVYDPDYLGKCTRKQDLVSRLNTLHKSLTTLSQEFSDRPSGLKSTAAQLVSDKILKHVDKDVRLLAVCCIVDIFRVFAPEAPYGDEEMIRVFEVINAQIRSLSNYEITSATGSKVLYILTSLATVKSCVVPVIMAQSGVQGAEDVMISLFDALISSFRPEHGEEGKSYPAITTIIILPYYVIIFLLCFFCTVTQSQQVITCVIFYSLALRNVKTLIKICWIFCSPRSYQQREQKILSHTSTLVQFYDAVRDAFKTL